MGPTGVVMGATWGIAGRLVLILLVIACIAAPAAGASGPVAVTSLPATPASFHVDAERAVQLALRTPDGHRAVDDGGDLSVAVTRADETWDWSVMLHRDGREILEVLVDGRSGHVVQTARYLEFGHVGGAADNPWLWALLCVAFVVPFIDPRRPFRLLHLDLAVLLAFGISHLLLTHGALELSVPLVYPPLAYLLVRMLLLARGRAGRDGPAVPFAPTALLLGGAALLLALRAGVALTTDQYSDVGYFSVVGADRIMAGEPLYAAGGSNGDTYGALNYLAYVPFELLWPWHEGILNPVAAKAASICWDVLVALVLFVIGRQLRPGRDGLRLGAALAYAWAAYPYGMYAAALGVNDGLVAALMLGALALVLSPLGRGGLIGAAAAVKFSPAVLLWLVARGLRRPGRRAVLIAGAAFAVAFAFPFLGHVPDGGLREIWDTTVGFQMTRESAFSPWGQHESLQWLQRAVGVLGVGVIVAASASRVGGDRARLAALAAAVLIAVQLPAIHWFYFYVVWFAPFALIGLLAVAPRSNPAAPAPVRAA
jgi:hypothetical protein